MFLSSKESLDVGDYSTSGYENIKHAKKRYNCMKKYEDSPIIMVGETDPKCGLSMRTKDSKTRKCKDSHIDWWIYETAHPEVLFSKVLLEEGGN